MNIFENIWEVICKCFSTIAMIISLMSIVIINIIAILINPAIIMVGLAGLYMHLAPLIPHITNVINENHEVVQFAHFMYNNSEIYAATIVFIIFTTIYCLFRLSGVIATVIIKFILWCVTSESHTVNITDPDEVSRAVTILGELPSIFSKSGNKYYYDLFDITSRCHDTVGLMLVYPKCNAENVITQIRIYAPFSNSMSDLYNLFAANELITEVLLEPGVLYRGEDDNKSYVPCVTNTKLQVATPFKWQKLAIEKISYVYNKFSKCSVLVKRASGTGRTSLARYVAHSLQNEGFSPIIIRGLSPDIHETPFAFLAEHAPVPTRLCPNIIVIENWDGLILTSRPTHKCQTTYIVVAHDNQSAIGRTSFAKNTERLKEFRDALLQLEYTIVIAIASDKNIAPTSAEVALIDRIAFPLQYTDQY